MAAVVSIIIPFYNEALYLHKAITSAVAQSYAHTEIILVNDGSTDGSLQIATAFQVQYPAIRIVTTINKGLGHARNTGMDLATGEYLTFLDSDDELKPEAVEVWVRIMQVERADMVVSRFLMVNPNQEINNMLSGWKSSGQTVPAFEGIRDMYEYRMSSTAWAKLYRTSIARQLRFPEGLWFEDRPFLLSYFLSSATIAFDESSQLHILSRPGSITRSLMSERRIGDAFRIYQLELLAVASHPEKETLTRLIDRHQINAMLEALILLYYDHKGHPQVHAVQRSFAEHVDAFLLHMNKNGTRIGLRDRADLLLIRLYRFLGWPLTFLILPFWKKKKCRAVLFLKSF